jgi:hypothetical protein
MVVRLTPASLDDGMPMNAWQRRRNLEVAGLTALADPDSGFAQPPLRDDMPADQWLWLRDRQARGLLPARPDGAAVRAAALSACGRPTR